jgi:hypothetical protein
LSRTSTLTRCSTLSSIRNATLAASQDTAPIVAMTSACRTGCSTSAGRPAELDDELGHADEYRQPGAVAPVTRAWLLRRADQAVSLGTYLTSGANKVGVT